MVPTLEPVGSRRGSFDFLPRVLYLLVLLFGFLVAIELMSKSIKALGEAGILGGGGAEGELFTGVSNPFAGLAIGVLFTVLVQSSSTTTATIVAVVGAGSLSVEHAVPMIMGANIGTTITNTLVSIGHVRRSAEFKRAFAAATVHDFFNLIVVAVLLPLELMTGVLAKTAGALTSSLTGLTGSDAKSPIKVAIKSAYKAVKGGLEDLGLEGTTLSVVCLAIGLSLTFLCLHQITGNMRKVIAGRIETAMTRALSASGVIGIVIGVLITVAVQSSSITTSLLVPMCAAGVMSLENAFPIMLGANIGTTVTGILASLAQDNPDALTIALVHVLFNLFGVFVLFPIKPLRRIPLRLSRALAEAATRNRWWVVIYVLGVFVAVPLAGWLIWGGAN